MMPTLASCSVDEMVSARLPSQTQWHQLYVNADRNLTKNIVLDVIRKGVKAICVTVDAPQVMMQLTKSWGEEKRICD
jgi:L-lactate dehydrogenase (cytochrome)